MKPVFFEGHNVLLGANQPQYQPLPAYKVGDTAGTIISCWELEPNDKLILEKTGRVWLSQLTFDQPLQPQLPSLTRPAALGVISGPVSANEAEPCCTDDPQECVGCRKPEDDLAPFVLKDGGRVALANEGMITVGANPFGICCPECGTVQMMEYEIHGRDGEETLDISLTRSAEETQRYRKHLGIPGTAQDVARQLIAVDDLVNQALAVVLPSDEELEDSPEKRVAQLITILGMHREVLANFRATMQHMVKGIEIARDAVESEINAQRLISPLNQPPYLLIAKDTLDSMLPRREEPKSNIILLSPEERG